MIRINLLPVRAEKRKENLRKHVLFIVAYLVCIGAVIASVHLTLKATEREARSRVSVVKNQISDFDKKIAEVQGYKKKFADLAEKIEIISGLEKKQIGPARVLFELASIVPEKVWLNSLSTSSNKINITGMAIDNRTLAGFMSALENSPRFEKVRLGVSRKETKEGVDLKAFNLEATVVSPGAKKDKEASKGGKKAG